MTGRTHDLAGFTALSYIVATQPLQPISLATALVAVGANFIGALAPDIDQSTGELWQHVRGGSVLGRLLAPLLGGHRLVSHSIIGIFLFAFLTKQFLNLISSVLLVDMNIVWWAFMIGFLSHLVMDIFTKEGIPLLFPIPIRFGIPPFKFLRVKTGGLLEKSFIFPGLIALNFYIYYTNYHKFLDFLRQYIK